MMINDVDGESINKEEIFISSNKTKEKGCKEEEGSGDESDEEEKNCQKYSITRGRYR